MIKTGRLITSKFLQTWKPLATCSHTIMVTDCEGFPHDDKGIQEKLHNWLSVFEHLEVATEILQ